WWPCLDDAPNQRSLAGPIIPLALGLSTTSRAPDGPCPGGRGGSLNPGRPDPVFPVRPIVRPTPPNGREKCHEVAPADRDSRARVRGRAPLAVVRRVPQRDRGRAHVPVQRGGERGDR